MREDKKEFIESLVIATLIAIFLVAVGAAMVFNGMKYREKQIIEHCHQYYKDYTYAEAIEVCDAIVLEKDKQ